MKHFQGWEKRFIKVLKEHRFSVDGVYRDMLSTMRKKEDMSIVYVRSPESFFMNLPPLSYRLKSVTDHLT